MRSNMNWALSALAILGLLLVGSVPAFAAYPASGAAAQAGPPAQSGPRTLPADSVPLVVRSGAATLAGPHEGADTLHLLFMLPMRDWAALNRFLADAGNPQSAHYGQYLTLAEANARFNPDVAHEQQVLAWLQGAGITQVQTVPNHLYVSAWASVSAINALLSVQINDYKLPDRTIYAPAQAPTLPAAVSSAVQWVVGLNNAAQYHKATNGTAHGHAPYYPQDLANAYDVNPLWAAGATGAGTTVALTLWGAAPSDATLTTWATTTGAAAVTRGNGRLVIVPVDGGSTYPDTGEAGLDIESSGGIAYQAQIRYYEAPTDGSGNPDTASLADTLNAAGTDGVNNRQISSSWGGDEDAQSIQAFEPILAANAATGHTYLFSSGDTGSAGTFNGLDPFPSYPSSSAYVLAVGGTRFSANVGPTWPGEVAWAYTPPPTGPEGSGGGYSNLINRPSWQVASGFSNTHRGYPDVSAVGDPATGYYTCYGNSSACAQIGGTSLSSPLWAGMLALTNQYLVAQGKQALGFAAPRMYELARVTQPYPPFHDITSGTNGAYNAGPGWDAVTGLGTPDLWNLARDLANQCLTQFADVAPDNPFYTYIRCLSCRNIISGYTTSPPCASGGAPCFQSGANVTRAQFAKIVANAAGYADVIPSTQQTFTDVPPSSPFWVYIERAVLHGVISGYSSSPPCTTGVPCFLPSNNVTRGQLAKIDTIAAGYSDAIPSTQQTFYDVPPSYPFWVYIERAALHAVISGYTASPPCPGGVPCFLPANNVTRGQTAKIVANSFFPSCQTP